MITINQVQDYANERSVALSIKATKITARLLAKAMQSFIKSVQNPKDKHGKQSLQSLTKKGAAIENIEISNDDIGSFKKTARKYNVDFALKKDANTDPPNWMVFFKAKDSKSLEQAFKEYTSEVLKHKTQKPSIAQTLQKAKEKIAITLPTPKKTRGKGDVEL